MHASEAQAVEAITSAPGRIESREGLERIQNIVTFLTNTSTLPEKTVICLVSVVFVVVADILIM